MNHKNERIWKLHKKGFTPEQICRKLGLPLDGGIDRVLQGIATKEAHLRVESLSKDVK